LRMPPRTVLILRCGAKRSLEGRNLSLAGEFLKRPFPGQLGEALLRRHAGGHRDFGVFVSQLVEAEPAALDNLEARRQRAFVAAEQPGHLDRRL
jgi:hypothetical protein